eukprot:gene19625-39044_t
MPLATTAQALGVEARRLPVGAAEAYASAAEFKADLDVLDRSLISNNSKVIARGRLRALRRAVDNLNASATLVLNNRFDITLWG